MSASDLAYSLTHQSNIYSAHLWLFHLSEALLEISLLRGKSQWSLIQPAGLLFFNVGSSVLFSGVIWKRSTDPYLCLLTFFYSIQSCHSDADASGHSGRQFKDTLFRPGANIPSEWLDQKWKALRTGLNHWLYMKLGRSFWPLRVKPMRKCLKPSSFLNSNKGSSTCRWTH